MTCVDAARAETARIYSGLTREHHSRARRLPAGRTAAERGRLNRALNDAIETAIAQTGSINGAMRATGCSYRTVQSVWREMNR